MSVKWMIKKIHHPWAELFFSPQLNRQSHLICSWIWENNVMYASELTTTAGKTNFPGGIRRLMKSDWFLLIPANVGPLHQISWSSPAFHPQRNDLILDKHRDRVIHPGSWIIHSIVHSRWGWHGLWGLLFFGVGGGMVGSPPGSRSRERAGN